MYLTFIVTQVIDIIVLKHEIYTKVTFKFEY